MHELFLLTRVCEEVLRDFVEIVRGARQMLVNPRNKLLEISGVQRVAVFFYPALYFVVPLKYAITRVPVVSGHLLHC